MSLEGMMRFLWCGLFSLTACLVLLDNRLVLSATSQASPSPRHKRLSAISNCSYSFGFGDTDENIIYKTPRSVLNLSPLSNATLEVINVGMGATGTKSLFLRDIVKYKTGCYAKKCIPNQFDNELKRHFELIGKCMDGSVEIGLCLARYWLVDLHKIVMRMASSGARLFADMPIMYLFSELVTLIPGLKVQNSLRNPFFLFMSRTADHRKGSKVDFMCNPSLVQTSNPFHILKCIEKSDYIHDLITTTTDFVGMDSVEALKHMNGEPVPIAQRQRIRLLADFYAAHNIFVMQHTDPRNYFPICTWDRAGMSFAA